MTTKASHDTLVRLGLLGASAVGLRAVHTVLLNMGGVISTQATVLLVVLIGGLAMLSLLWSVWGQWLNKAWILVILVCLLELCARGMVAVDDLPPYLYLRDEASVHAAYAAELMLEQRNPYAVDYTDSVAMMGNPSADITYSQDGTPSKNLRLPPLLPLIVALFQALGIAAFPTIGMVAYIASLLALSLAAPLELKPLAPLALFAADILPFSERAAYGDLHLVWASLLLLAVLTWHRPRLSGLACGLALGAHTLTLMALPFLLIWRWRMADAGFGRWLWTLILSTTLIQLPFFLWNPIVYSTSLQSFFSANSLYSYNGLGALVASRNLDSITYLFIWAFIGMFWVYMRFLPNLYAMAWAIPAIFAWRWGGTGDALWMLVLLPLVASLILKMPHSVRAIRLPKIVVAGWFVIGMGLMAFTMLTPQNFQPTVRIQSPFWVDSEARITTFSLDLHNTSETPIAPRFFLLSRYNAHPRPWDIVIGEPSLAPNQSATYQIQSRRLSDTFISQGRLLVVDANSGETHSIRLPLEETYAFADSMFNSTLSVWSLEEEKPEGWSLATSPSASVTLEPVMIDDREAVELEMISSGNGFKRASLQNIILFPREPMHIWLYMPPTQDDAIYSLEVDDGMHQITLLFSENGGQNMLSTSQFLVREAISTGEWVRYRLDVPSLYAEAGWQMPPLQDMSYRGVYSAFRTMTFRFVVASRESTATIHAYFGGVEQDSRSLDPRILMDEALDNPAAYFQRLGETHLSMRNYRRAEVAFRRALQASPNDPVLQEQLRNAEEQAAWIGGEID